MVACTLETLALRGQANTPLDAAYDSSWVLLSLVPAACVARALRRPLPPPTPSLSLVRGSSQLSRLNTGRAAVTKFRPTDICRECSADKCLCGGIAALYMAAEEGSLHLKLCVFFARAIKLTSEKTYDIQS